MTFPFSFPYDDEVGLIDPSFVMATNEQDLLPSPWPASASASAAFPSLLQQEHEHQYHSRHANANPTPSIPPRDDPAQPPTARPASPSTTTTTTSTCADTSTCTYRSEPARWRALVARDAGATDAFVYAVVTTKIYCRPDCRARLARRANVRFYDRAAHAERAGFRACKRCRPSRARTAAAAAAGSGSVLSSSSSSPSPRSAAHPTAASCRRILPGCASAQTSPGHVGDADGGTHGDGNADVEEAAEPEDIHAKIHRAAALVRHAASADPAQVPSLAQLAAHVGLSKWHLQRVFKALQGVSPREMAERIIRANKHAAQGGRVSGTNTSTPSSSSRSPLLTDPAVSADEEDAWPSDAWTRAWFTSKHPSSPRVAEGLAFPCAPLPPAPLMLLPLPLPDDETGVAWFNAAADESSALLDYCSTQPAPREREREQEREEAQPQLQMPPLPAPFADRAHHQSLTMPLHEGMDTNHAIDIDMDADVGAVDLHAAEVEGLLNDLFPEVLVY